MELFSSIHQFKIPIPDNPLGFTNVYFVKSSAGNLLIDVGWPSDEAFDSLQAQMEEAGGSWQDLRLVFLTHAHPDHYGLLGRVAQVARPELVVHAKDLLLMQLHQSYTRTMMAESKQEGFLDLMNLHGVKNPPSRQPKYDTQFMMGYVPGDLPEKIVEDGERLRFGDFDFEIFWTPGHSQGHICLYEPNNQLLFTGDHVLLNISPNISQTNSIDNPLGDYLASLKKVARIPAKKVLPAHGPIFANLQGRVDELLLHHENRANAVEKALKKGPRNGYQVSDFILWTDDNLPFSQLPVFVQPMAVSETVAHLVYLERLGKVKERLVNDQIYYVLVN